MARLHRLAGQLKANDRGGAIAETIPPLPTLTKVARSLSVRVIVASYARQC